MLSNLKIKILLKNAKKFFDEGDFDEALINFDKILLLDNTNEEALYKKAFILYKKNRICEAINLLHRIIDHNPDEESFLLLGRLYFLIGDYEKGIVYYTLALNEDVFNLSEYIDEILFFGGDWELKYISKDFKRFSKYSLVLCDLIIDRYDDIGTKIWKAYKLYSLNCFEESLELINEVINLGQEDYSIYYLKSANLIELTLFKEALDASEKGLSLNSEDVLLNQNKAIALYHLGIFDESFEFFKKSIDLDETTNSYFFLSRIELINKNFKKSLDYINKAIELQLNNFHDLKDSSIEFYNVFINYDQFLLKSLILYNLNEFDEANMLCDCLIEKEPENAKNYCLKSMILFEEGKYEESLGFIQKTLDLNPDCEEAIELKEKLGTKMNNTWFEYY